MYVCIHMEASIYCLPSLFSFFWSSVSHWAWNSPISPIQLVKLASKPQGSSHLQRPSTWMTSTHHHTLFFSHGSWESVLRPPWSYGKRFTKWAISLELLMTSWIQCSPYSWSGCSHFPLLEGKVCGKYEASGPKVNILQSRDPGSISRDCKASISIFTLHAVRTASSRE